MNFETISSNICFEGAQSVYAHESAATKTRMEFSVFAPPQMQDASVPVLWYLSGLTCNWENATVKAGAQRYAAEQGVMLIFPDTSPRGNIPDEDTYDFGTGAGFYLNATQEPWSTNYNMYNYVTEELPGLIEAQFPHADLSRQGITGHSMGGHGALSIALKNADRYKSVSAFAPIVAPSQADWSIKAFNRYLGEDQANWREYDSVSLIEDGKRVTDILVDQGAADQFLNDGLKPWLLEDACKTAGIPLEMNMRDGYDHSYYFVSSFIGNHIAWHAKRLKG